MRAIAEMMQQAAAGSQQVLSSIAPTAAGGVPFDSTLLRDAIAEMERSFTRVYNIAGSFMTERPFRAAGGPGHPTPVADIVVMDGVGTTSIEIDGAAAVPHCGDLRRHDGASISADAVRIVRSTSFGSDGATFVVRIDAGPSVSPGVYHGQLLVEGLPDRAFDLTAHVIAED